MYNPVLACVLLMPAFVAGLFVRVNEDFNTAIAQSSTGKQERWLSIELQNGQIPSNAFSEFANLQNLTVHAEVGDKDARIDRRAFANAASLESIVIANVDLSQTGFPMITDLHRLDSIQLRDTRLSGTISSQDFRGTRLRTLEIYGDASLNIADDTFSSSIDLRELIVDGCSSDRLPASISALGQLRALSWRNCRLLEISIKLPITLEMLDFSGNRLRNLPASSFTGLHQLTTLQLTRNNIVDVDGRLFADTPKLSRLNMDGNRLQALSPGLFAELEDLTSLSLSGNLLTRFDRSILQIPDEVITELNLSNNRLEIVRLPAFEQDARVDLSKNLIELIDRSTFKRMPIFATLNLNNNPISEIADGSFADVSISRELKFYKTRLKYFSFSSLYAVRRVSRVLFEKNAQLIGVQKSGLPAIILPNSLREIAFISNPNFVFTDPDGQLQEIAKKWNITFHLDGVINCHCGLKEMTNKAFVRVGHHVRCSNLDYLQLDEFLSMDNQRQYCGCSNQDETRGACPNRASLAYGSITVRCALIVLLVSLLRFS